MHASKTIAYAALLLEAGEPVRRIQAILRHKKLSTTERYLHQLEDLKTTLRVLEKRDNVVYVGVKKKQKAFREALCLSEGLELIAQVAANYLK